MRKPARGATRHVPVAVGGALLAVGLGLGLWARPTRVLDPQRAPSAASTGSAPPDADDAADVANYRPDLSGPNAGEQVLSSEQAHGLGTVGDELVWLVTDRASIFAAPLAGGAPRRVWASDSNDRFGGDIAIGKIGAFWVVEHEGDDAEVIQLLTPDAAKSGGAPTRVASGESPAMLVTNDEELFWVDRGGIVRGGPGREARRIVERDLRIAALALHDRTLYWLELPYAQRAVGAHDVLSLAVDGGAPRQVTRLAAPAERAHLYAASGTLVLGVRMREGEGSLETVATSGGRVRKLTTLGRGLVTAMTVQGAAVYWAERHEQGEAAVTLLRRIALDGGVPERLGRDDGAVGALMVREPYLYWSTESGIKRLELPARAR